jgi:hypothetical protein
MRPLLAALALACTAAAQAAPAEALEPMAFLAGHCWKGPLGDGKGSDEHCFAWLHGGQALRDTHTVRVPGKPDALGETTYYVDTALRRVEFLYLESGGGLSRGAVEATPDGLAFTDARYVEAGDTLFYRARWTRQGDAAYEAWAEAQTPTGWRTMLRVVLRRSD